MQGEKRIDLGALKAESKSKVIAIESREVEEVEEVEEIKLPQASINRKARMQQSGPVLINKPAKDA